MALSMLPQLIICLVLIGAVIAVRHAIKALTTKRVVESSVAQGRTALKATAEEAKETLASLGADVKRDLDRLVGGSASPMAPDEPPMRCPRCGRVSRPGARYCEGCGAALFVRCPRCGRTQRADANFCAECGKSLKEKA